MEDKKTIIDKIKAIVFAEDVPVNEEVIDEGTDEIVLDIKTQDGSILRIEGDTLKEGVMIWMVNEDGLQEVPDSEFILEDGKSKLITDAESKISSIEEVVEEPAEEVVQEEMSNEETDGERITKIEQTLASLIEKFSKVETGINLMTEKVKAISNEPAEEEIKITKTGFKSDKAKQEDTLNALARFRK